MGRLPAIVVASLGLFAADLAAAGPGKKPSVVAARSKAQQPAQDIASFSAEMPSKTVAGFRMEGAPEVEVVFGDIDHYKGHIDRFYKLSEEMASARQEFAAATHRAQKILAQLAGCPQDMVAADYYRASENGIAYRRLGARFEGVYQAIKTLHELGETSGLTPDYRWKVNKAKRMYQLALTDLREMRAAFSVQLEAELKVHGCELDTLLALGKEDASEKPPMDHHPVLVQPKPRRRRWRNEPPKEIVPASTATFFVNNKSCKDRLRVEVDSTLLGEVAPGTRAAFQSLAGRHQICLLGASDVKRCGQTGTTRTAFVYDGWSITRNCDAKGRPAPEQGPPR
jgi:hypothetical protein